MLWLFTVWSLCLVINTTKAVEGALPWWNITEIGNENPECSLKYLSIPSTVSEPTSKMTSVWDSTVLNLIFLFRVTSWETVELFKFSFSNHLIFTTVWSFPDWILTGKVPCSQTERIDTGIYFWNVDRFR